MKLTSRGFTLVELMIVIAIIGILAAALFPSMTGYLKRSRDAARAASMKDIATSLGAYYADKEGYPSATGGSVLGCAGNAATASAAILTSLYMPKGIPTDPVSTYTQNGCVSLAGSYGYASGNISGSPFFILVATFENINAGNTGSIQAATGNVAVLPLPSKGAGAGYVLSN